jgi:hypothetical protein
MAGDAFLDVIGAEAPAPGRRPSPRVGPPPAGDGPMTARGRRLAIALAPLAAMLAVLGLVALTGLSRRSGVPPVFEPYAYGYFLDRYPLFAFALVYAAARIVSAALGAGSGGRVRRVVFGVAGLAALAVAGLYPTFGGLALRGGFATGGMAFLTGQPLWLAYALGAGVAAAMTAGIVGGFALLANGSLRPRLRRIGWGGLSFLLLWFGAVVIGLGREFGTGPWPARAFTGPEAGLAAALLVLAALPHTALLARRSQPAGA